jgi:nucleolar MIF4G domain-containing protein 1
VNDAADADGHRDDKGTERTRPPARVAERTDATPEKAASIQKAPVASSKRTQQQQKGKRPRVAIPLDILADLGNTVNDLTSTAATTAAQPTPGVPAASSSSAIRPALRASPAVKIAVQRICNKLTVQNAATLTKSLLDLFEIEGHPRSEVLDAFSQVMDDGLLKHTALTSTVALAYAGVIRALQLRHGNAAAGRFFEFVAVAAEVSLVQDDEVTSKNCGTLIAHLLLMHACDHALVTTFIDRCVKQASITALQAALAAVRAAGDRLRVDCPSELNALVDRAEAVLRRCERARDTAVPLVRLSVFVDVLRSIASGKAKTSAGTGAVGEVDRNGIATLTEGLQEFVASFESNKAASNKRSLAKAVASTQVLHCSFQQCCQLPKAPQWWTQLPSAADGADGAASTLEEPRVRRAPRVEDGEMDGDDDDMPEWRDEEGEEDDGVDDEGEGEASFEDEEAEQRGQGSAAPKLSDQERKMRDVKQIRGVETAITGQRFTTELRRNIFNAIANSHDDTDCFHRLMSLGASTATNLPDIAAVLLQCAVQDKTINPFYSRVLQRLVSGQKKFRMALQFALWDRFKGLHLAAVDVCGYINLAAVVTFLVRERVYGLPLLRGLDVDQGIGKNVGLFLRVFILRLLLEFETKRIADYFFGLDATAVGASAPVGFDVAANTSAVKASMRKSLKKFFDEQFADEESAALWMPPLIEVVSRDMELTPKDVDQLAAKISVAKRALREGV